MERRRIIKLGKNEISFSNHLLFYIFYILVYEIFHMGLLAVAEDDEYWTLDAKASESSA